MTDIKITSTFRTLTINDTQNTSTLKDQDVTIWTIIKQYLLFIWQYKL